MNLQANLMSMFLTAVLFCASTAQASLHCSTVLESALFKRYNPTAQYSAKEYVQPNDRGLEEYNSILLQLKSRQRSLLDFLPAEQAVVVDVGGGHGLAMRELVQQRPAKAIVINTQDYSREITLELEQMGLQFRTGWAEEVLTKMESNSVDLLTDLWGGFSYSPRKDLLLEQAYRVLKPGASALILFHPTKTPTFVHASISSFKVLGMGVMPRQRDVALDHFLVERFPKVITSYRSEDPSYSLAKIIKISKPLRHPPETLELGLQIIETELIETPRNVYPKVRFVEVSE